MDETPETYPTTKAKRKEYTPTDCGGKYWFDTAGADKACEFFDKYLYDSRGERFILLPWQRKIVRDIFGWKVAGTNRRRYKWVYILIGRKNGKSEFAAGMSLLLTTTAPTGAEIYAAAATRQQASIIFQGRCKEMIRNSPGMSDILEERQYEIRRTDANVSFSVLSGESKGSHGKNIYALIVDELHEWKTARLKELWTALTTSRNAWPDSLVVMITTAGYGGDASIWTEQDEKARKVRDNEAEDETFYPAIYGLEAAEDWQLESNWRRVNPSLDHIFSIEVLREEYKRCKGTSEENEFRRLYLCQTTAQQTRWLPEGLFKSRAAPLKYDDHKGNGRLVLGLDLSESYDLTAIALLYLDNDDGKWHILVRLFMPADNVERRTKDDGFPYRRWVDAGHITATDGETIDYQAIGTEILQIANENTIERIAYDPSGALMLAKNLERAGYEGKVIPVIQKHYSMSNPSKEFERRLVNGDIVVDDNPVLQWMADNVEIAHQSNEIRPVKPSAKGKYSGTRKYKNDGIVASIIAIAQGMLLPKENTDNGIGFFTVGR